MRNDSDKWESLVTGTKKTNKNQIKLKLKIKNKK